MVYSSKELTGFYNKNSCVTIIETRNLSAKRSILRFGLEVRQKSKELTVQLLQCILKCNSEGSEDSNERPAYAHNGGRGHPNTRSTPRRQKFEGRDNPSGISSSFNAGVGGLRGGSNSSSSAIAYAIGVGLKCEGASRN